MSLSVSLPLWGFVYVSECSAQCTPFVAQTVWYSTLGLFAQTKLFVAASLENQPEVSLGHTYCHLVDLAHRKGQAIQITPWLSIIAVTKTGTLD